MRVVYSVSTRIGASGLGVDSFEALKGIYARGCLKRVVAYGNRQKEIPSALIRSLGIGPYKIFSNLPARYYYPMKMKALDRVAVRVLRKGADLFHGWSGSSLRSLRYCREEGIPSFMENPAPHFRYSDEVMGADYDSLGIRWRKDPELFPRFFGFGPDYLQGEYEAARYLILESEFTRDTFLAQGVPASKLVVLPRGVDTVRFRPPEGPRADRPFRVVFFGPIGVRKGARYLLDAWSKLKLRDAELVMLGSMQNDVRTIVERIAAADPTIRLVGFVKDYVRFYHESSVFVLPSLSEGSAKVTYEAMACGLPVIVTPNAGSVARDGEDGFLIPPRDSEALQEKLLKLYEDRGMRETMGRNARKRIETFTWDAHRKELLAVYEAAYAGKPVQTGTFRGTGARDAGRSGVKIALYELLVTVSYGGIQTTYWETAGRLARMGHEVHLYGGEGTIRRELPEGVKILTFPFTARERFPDLGSRFRKIAERVTFGRNALATLLRNRYDVIYIRKPYEFPISLYVRRKTGAKVVYRSGGTEFYPGYGYLASRLDALLACSRYNAGQIRDYCGLQPDVLHNGVDTDRFVPLPRSPEVADRLGLSDGDFVVMSVGRLVGWKGFQYGIRAVSRLDDRRVKYVIVGDGESRRGLEREAGELGMGDRVVFTGYVAAKEMPEYYSVADVVLFPTIGDDDAFPNTLCEAMACGKPVVGTRKGGIPEGIEEGKTGFVVEARDAGAIAAALNDILRDPERRGSMGRRARERAVERFSWDVIVKRLEEIFQEICRQVRDGS